MVTYRFPEFGSGSQLSYFFLELWRSLKIPSNLQIFSDNYSEISAILSATVVRLSYTINYLDSKYMAWDKLSKNGPNGIMKDSL